MSEPQFVRAIGFRQLTASIVNATVGAGIFVLPATAGAMLGPAAPGAYLVCGALMTLIALCFAAAGSRVSKTGGLYAYIDTAFGPLTGFIAGILYSSMAAFGVASVAVAFVGSIGAAWDAANIPWIRAAILTALFAVLAYINVRGVKPGTRIIEAITLAKLIPLLALVMVGVWFVRADFLRWPNVPSPSSVGQAAVVVIYAFAGVEIAIVPGGEVHDPSRTVPRAVLTALGTITILYLLVQIVAQGLLGSSIAAYPDAPLAEAGARIWGTAGRTLILAGATISMFGYVAGDLLGSPRALYALGRDRALPAAFAQIHPRFHTPHIAIAVYAAVVAGLSITSGFTTLAVLTNVAALTIYLLAVAASYLLQRRGVRGEGAPFVLPGGGIIPVAAGATILWLLTQVTRRELLVEAGVIGLGFLLYVMRRRFPSRAA